MQYYWKPSYVCGYPIVSDLASSFIITWQNLRHTVSFYPATTQITISPSLSQHEAVLSLTSSNQHLESQPSHLPESILINTTLNLR